MPAGSFTVNGQYFSGVKAPIWFLQGSTTNQVIGTANVAPDGTFQATVRVPITATPGQATIRACGDRGLGPCAYATITISLTG